MADIGETIVYHGSYREIEVFKPIRYVGAAGVYFTPCLDQAWDYARCACIEEGDVATVMCAKIDVRNPVVLHGIASHEISEADVAAYRAAGHDGAVGVGADGVVFEYVVFDPDQISIEEIMVEELGSTSRHAR